jgi:hypothetical protein
MGGSALGMRVCREFGIPFFNIRSLLEMAAFRGYLDGRQELRMRP